MYGLLNIIVCQGEWEHWKRWALRTASPCYRAVTLRDFKTVQPVIYRFQISCLTFDFPLQLRFNLHFSTRVSTIQFAKRLFVKGCFWYQVPAKLLWTHSNPNLAILVFGVLLLQFLFNVLHLGLSIYIPLCNVLKRNLLPTHHKIKYLTFFLNILSFGVSNW